MPEIVFETDDKGNPTYLNSKASEITGYSHDELMQMNVLQLLIPEDRQRARENIQKRMQGEKSTGNEYTQHRKDGTTFKGITFSDKITIEDGKPGMRGVIVDISKISESEEALKKANEKLRVIGGLTRHDIAN